jgi:hypothetical protein
VNGRGQARECVMSLSLSYIERGYRCTHACMVTQEKESPTAPTELIDVSFFVFLIVGPESDQLTQTAHSL